MFSEKVKPDIVPILASGAEQAVLRPTVSSQIPMLREQAARCAMGLSCVSLDLAGVDRRGVGS